jgi:hypothetical protein
MCRGRRQATTEKKAPACGSNQSPDIAAEGVASKTCLCACTTMLRMLWRRLKRASHRGDGTRDIHRGLRSAMPPGTQKRRENKPLRARFVQRTLKPAHLYRIYHLWPHRLWRAACTDSRQTASGSPFSSIPTPRTRGVSCFTRNGDRSAWRSGRVSVHTESSFIDLL